LFLFEEYIINIQIYKKEKSELLVDNMPIITIILYSFPESYLIFWFGLVIIGHKLKFQNIMLATILSVFFSHAIRRLPLPFGLHTVIGLLIVCLLFLFIFKLDIKKAIFVTLISIGTLIALENTVLYFLQLELHLPLKEIWKHPLLRTFIGWPHLIIWLIITLFIYNKNLRLLSNSKDDPNV